MSGKWKLRFFGLVPMLLLVLGLSGCGYAPMSALDPAGPVAAMQLELIYLSFWVMTGVTAVVAIIFTYVLIRYRKRPGSNGDPEQVEGNKWLEITWIVIPFILLIVLAIPTISQTFKLADVPTDPDTLTVKVVGKQFWWEFEYPDLGIVTANELYIPAGEKISFELTSTDVIHSFWVPRLGGKIDNNPGHVTTFWLQADEPGIYPGVCAELCGQGHALMGFNVIAQTPEDFQSWVAQMKNPQVEPTTDLAKQGEELFAANCASCHAVAGTGFNGKLGPDLTGYANRLTVGAALLENNPEELAAWIKDSPAIKPGVLMPSFNDTLDDAQIGALVEYMNQLK